MPATIIYQCRLVTDYGETTTPVIGRGQFLPAT